MNWMNGYDLPMGIMGQQPAPWVNGHDLPEASDFTLSGNSWNSGYDLPMGTQPKPTWRDRLSGAFEDPLFHLGVNLMGNATGPNPFGRALQGTLESHRQAQLYKLKQREAGIHEINAKTGMQNAETNAGRLKHDQEELGIKRPLYEAQTKNYETTARQKDEDITLEREKLARDKAFLEQIYNYLNGGQGAVPQTPPALQMQPAPAVGPTGKFGTPTSILDGLSRTESSGNPKAINSQSGAQGEYQFLPATTKMLSGMGMPFDPMDGAQSRDAADFYLQHLLKQNGGDMKKALAAYGGFVTKDPSQYIAKVMGQEAPVQQPAAPAASQQGGVADPNRLLNAGAMMAMNPGFAQSGRALIDVAKARMPNMSGGFIHDPVTGQVRQLDDKYRAADAAATERRVRVDESRETREGVAQARKTEVDQANDKLAYTQTVGSLDRMEGNINELLGHKGLAANTGLSGMFKAYNLTPEGRDASVLLEGLKSKIVVEAMTALKEASKTGATGFGQLSEKEGETLRSLIANLDRSQTEAQMRKALGDLSSFAKQSRKAFDTRYGELYGGVPQADNDPLGLRKK